MNLSRYILKYSTDDGTLYFNTKTNHSFFLTNELNRVVDSNDVIRKEFHAYLDKSKYLSEGDLNCTPKVRQKKSNFWGVL